MIDYDYFIVGKQVKKYRLAKELTQAQLGELSGVSRGFISDIERGKGTEESTIKLERIYRIAEVLEVKLDDLAGLNLECHSDNNEIINEILNRKNDLDDRDFEILNRIINIAEKVKFSSSKR